MAGYKGITIDGSDSDIKINASNGHPAEPNADGITPSIWILDDNVTVGEPPIQDVTPPSAPITPMPAGSINDIPSNALALGLKILPTINAQDLRCNTKGDPFAEAIYNNGSGYYVKLSKAFDNIAVLCNKTLKNKKIDVASIKDNLKVAKKKAMSQRDACAQRKVDMQKIYSETKDIFTAVNE